MNARVMKYEDYILLDFVLRARKPVSAREVHSHLLRTVEGYPERQPKDGGYRNVQNRLRTLSESEHFSCLMDVTLNGKKLLYKGIESASDREPPMSIEQACAILMSDKHLSALAPTRLFQSQDEYRELIVRAEAAVKQHQQFKIMENNHIGDFMKRVTVVQRGQALIGATVDDEVLECIADCIVKKRCIEFTYDGKQRVVHPFGLVFRQPKIYLLAVDTDKLKSQGPSKVRPRQFLCNRIEKAKKRRKAHQVPENFDVNEYVGKGRLEMLAYTDTDTVDRSFTLKLRIYAKDSDNLVRDLEESPLSSSQEIISERGTDNCILSAKGMRATHSLGEWLMGRMDRVEVMRPASLRNHVVERLEAMQKRYQR